MAGKFVRRRRGFTLIELMIVVAIIGVLAAVAIPSFLNYQLTSKRSEAYANLGALAKAQKAYFAEFNAFVSVEPEPGTALGFGPNSVKRDKTSIESEFATVGWVPDGDVYFDYDTATSSDPLLGNCATCPEGCFTSTAYGDLDNNGRISALIYAHPDPLGEFCESGLRNLSPPIDSSGQYRFDEVVRVNGADDF